MIQNVNVLQPFLLTLCKSLNISIGTVMKNPEMLNFFPDHPQTKKM